MNEFEVDHYRLGDKRRMRSEYSIHQRGAGSDFQERTNYKRAKMALMTSCLCHLHSSGSLAGGIQTSQIMIVMFFLIAIIV